MSKILFVGFATVDLIGDKNFPGGAAGGMSINAATLGVESYLLAPLSKDERGEWYTRILADREVNTSLCDFESPSIPTCRIEDIQGLGSKRDWHDNGAREFLAKMKIPDTKALERFDAIMLCNALPPLPERLATNIDKRVIFYIPGPQTVSHPELISEMVLQKTEIIFGNESEALGILSKQPFSLGVKLVVITLGARGGTVYDAEGNVTHFSAPKVKAKDITGAGDCFSLGFTKSWLEDYNVDPAIQAGLELAARIVQQLGVIL